MVAVHAKLVEQGCDVLMATHGGAYEFVFEQRGIAYEVIEPRLTSDEAARLLEALTFRPWTFAGSSLCGAGGPRVQDGDAATATLASGPGWAARGCPHPHGPGHAGGVDDFRCPLSRSAAIQEPVGFARSALVTNDLSRAASDGTPLSCISSCSSAVRTSRAFSTPC